MIFFFIPITQVKKFFTEKVWAAHYIYIWQYISIDIGVIFFYRDARRESNLKKLWNTTQYYNCKLLYKENVFDKINFESLSIISKVKCRKFTCTGCTSSNALVYTVRRKTRSVNGKNSRKKKKDIKRAKVLKLNIITTNRYVHNTDKIYTNQNFNAFSISDWKFIASVIQKI